MASSDAPLVSVVIPAFNEARKIYRDLENACEYFDTAGYPYELIVVDDGSTDGTAQEVRRFQEKRPAVRLIEIPKNRGKGYAVRTGALESTGRHILFADAGNCVPYQEVEKGLRLLRDGCEIAIGSRALRASTILVKQPWHRRIGAKIFRFFVHYGMGLSDIQDTQCGFKLFQRTVAQALFTMQRVDGFMFDIETLVNAKRLGYRIQQFPVVWSNDSDTRFKPISGSIRNFKELLVIKWAGLNSHREG